MCLCPHDNEREGSVCPHDDYEREGSVCPHDDYEREGSVCPHDDYEREGSRVRLTITREKVAVSA